MKSFQLLRAKASGASASAKQHIRASYLRSTKTVSSQSIAPPRISPLQFLIIRPIRCAHLRRSPIPCTPRTLRRPYSMRPASQDPVKPPSNQLSVTQRFRKLTREYGWAATGIYLGLSALDFPLCFIAIRALGVERVGRAEKIVAERIGILIPESVKDAWKQMKAGGQELFGLEDRTAPNQRSSEVEVIEEYDHQLEEAEKANKSEHASIWTQLAVAYAIHKSFIFIRLPVTVAITPKVVKKLRSWGWDIGKRRPKVVTDPKG